MKTTAIFVTFCLSVLPAGAAAPRLTLGACNDPELPKDARCGTYQVFENRAAKTGRKIPLRVVVLPALGPDRRPDAVVSFSGGPGESSVGDAGFWASVLARVAPAPRFPAGGLAGDRRLGAPRCPELQGRPGFPRRLRARREGARLPRAAAQGRRPLPVHHRQRRGRRGRGARRARLPPGERHGGFLRHAVGPGLSAPPPGPGAHRDPRRRGADTRPGAALLRPQHAEGPGRPGGGVRGGRGLRPGVPPSPGRDRRGARAGRAGAGPRAAHRSQDRQAV